MRQSLRSTKIIAAMLLLMVFFAGSVLAFPHSDLGSAGKSPTNALTVAGQARSCSEYADETGTFIGAKTITTKVSPALVNIYYVDANGGWAYYNEFNIPQGSNSLAFSGGNRQYAYEVYYCPQTVGLCLNGQVGPVTEHSYHTCVNGAWGPETQCPALYYFSPQDGKCISPTCKEQWSCGQWGQCTAAGNQYRSCTDNNRCGTFRDQPATKQTCTPTLTTGAASGTTGDGLKLVGQPKLDAYTGSSNQARTVTQTFKVVTPGQYWIEAGIEQMRGFSITDVEQNTCNPNEPWYANELVTFSAAGEQTRTFTVTPQADGEYVLHTAIVTGCGGEVVQQVNAADHLFIGAPESGKIGDMFGGFGGSTFILIGIGVILVGALFFRRGRR